MEMCYDFRNLHFGKGININKIMDPIFCAEFKSINGTMIKVLKDFEPEILTFIYCEHKVGPERAHQVIEMLQCGLKSYESNIVLYYPCQADEK